MKNSKVSIKFIVLICFAVILGVIFVPIVLNIKSTILAYKYDKTQSNIINSAKSKYVGDINSLDQKKEYTIQELVEEGFLKGNEINPVTGKKYDKDDKVIIVEKNGVLSFEYVNGKTISEIVKDKKNVSELNNNYYFVGNNPNNYISFNEEIYRIICVNSNEEVYIIKDELLKNVEKSEIRSFLKTYVNDEIKDEYRKLIIDDPMVLTFDLYKNTMFDDNTFIGNDNYIWMNKEEYIVYDAMSKEIVDSEKAWINPVLIIDGNNTFSKGNGSRLSPYVIY